MFAKHIHMKSLKIFSSVVAIFSFAAAGAQTTMVNHFDKVIVSPYIQVTLVQGDQESVTVNDIHVDASKLHIEVNGQTLRVYLTGAKDIPKYEKHYSDGYQETHPLYQNTSVVATITYKNLTTLSFRGEETQFCESPVSGNELKLRIYGESSVIFNEVNLQRLEATMYGEGTLEIKSGSAREQKYLCYGEGKINTMAISGNTSHITAYGEADFTLNVSDRIKVTAFGDARLHYKGTPEIVKGLHIGDMLIDRID